MRISCFKVYFISNARAWNLKSNLIIIWEFSNSLIILIDKSGMKMIFLQDSEINFKHKWAKK